MENVDTQLAAIARDHHGLVTLQQALYWGLSQDQVRSRLRSGRWVKADRGVYRLAGAPTSWRERALAVCLAAPDGASTSHLTAAALAGLPTPPPPKPHLTVGRGRSARLPSAIVHRTRLTLADVTIIDAIPTTTIGRTLIDCAALLSPMRLQPLVNDALHRQLLRPHEVAQLWDKARLGPGRAGEVRLRNAVEPWLGNILPGSPAEIRLQRQVVEWGYPRPELQVRVADETGRVIARLDVAWRAERVGIEYDSARFHDPSRWAADEDRHSRVVASGWTLLHADKADLQAGNPSLRRALARAWRASAA